MNAYTGLCVGIIFILAATSVRSDESPMMPSPTQGRPIALPFDGSGQLIAIVSRGPDRPANYSLVLASSAGAAVLPFDEPFTARWRSPAEIIASRNGPGLAGEIMRVDRLGDTIEVLSQRGLAFPRPSPDGRLLAVARLDNTPAKKGIVALEIRDLAAGFATKASFSHHDVDTILADVAWSPDGTQLAIDLASNESDGRVRSRLGIISLADHSVHRPYDSAEDLQRDEAGMIPLFWTEDGIYVRSQRGVVRCDPGGRGCQAVYDPGPSKGVLAGTSIGDREALILVHDLHDDPIEARAKEIHRLNLTTGKGGVSYRFPDDVFISSIDWIR